MRRRRPLRREGREDHAVPSHNRVFFEGVAAAFNEMGGASRVDFARTDRAPLRILIGDRDSVVPPAIGKAILKRHNATGSPAIVDCKEYPGRTHRIVSQDGWEEVADHALDWALTHAASVRV